MRTPGLLLGKVRVLPALALCYVVIALCSVVVAMSGNALAAPLVIVGPQYSVPGMPLKVSTITPTPLSSSQAKVFRLTSGGCCPYPSWSQDSSWVPFLDHPGPDEPAGLYAIPANGGEVSLILERVGVYTEDWSRVTYQDGNRTIVERWADMRRWEIPNEGRQVRFSPSGQWIEWEVISHGIKFPDLRQRAIWLATYDGMQAREIVTVNGGEFVGWTSEEDAIIVTGRLAPYGPSGIWRISIEDGAGLLLLEIENPRRALLSPEGGWVAFTITFNIDSELNGLWLMRIDGSMLKKLDMFGAYRWRKEGVLLVIPLNLESPGPSLWQVDASDGGSVQLTDPTNTPLPIANNDWVPSPDGTRIVFLSLIDRNLWILELPEP